MMTFNYIAKIGAKDAVGWIKNCSNFIVFECHKFSFLYEPFYFSYFFFWLSHTLCCIRYRVEKNPITIVTFTMTCVAPLLNRPEKKPQIVKCIFGREHTKKSPNRKYSVFKTKECETKADGCLRWCACCANPYFSWQKWIEMIRSSCIIYVLRWARKMQVCFCVCWHSATFFVCFALN